MLQQWYTFLVVTTVNVEPQMPKGLEAPQSTSHPRSDVDLLPQVARAHQRCDHQHGERQHDGLVDAEHDLR